MAKLCPGLVWSTLWLMAVSLMTLVNLLVACLYVLLLPFGPRIEGVKGLCESLLKVIQLPLTYAENMAQMKAFCG